MSVSEREDHDDPGEAGPPESPRPRAAARSFFSRYGFALLCVAVAFGVRYSLRPLLGDELPFMLFIAAALVAAWYGGAVTGIVALLLGLFLADHFFIIRNPPAASERALNVFRFSRYVFTALLGVGIIEVLHRGKRRRDQALRELWREVERRKQSEAALRHAKAMLSRHAEELERRVAERTQRLSETVASLEDLLYQIAHNLRAPLRAIEGYITIIQEEQNSGAASPAREYSARVVRAAERMDDLIHDLLSYGRLCHEEVKLEQTRLEECIDAVLFRSQPEVESARAKISVDRPLPAVLANPAVLQQVIRELIENALKFARAGVEPSIHFSAERRGEMVRLWIADNGMGIEPQYRAKIFEAFQQLHPSEKYGGTGIGLSVAQKGMQRMGGSIGVESEPGEGSRFWLELPSAGASIGTALPLIVERRPHGREVFSRN